MLNQVHIYVMISVMFALNALLFVETKTISFAKELDTFCRVKLQ